MLGWIRPMHRVFSPQCNVRHFNKIITLSDSCYFRMHPFVLWVETAVKSEARFFSKSPLYTELQLQQSHRYTESFVWVLQH